MVILLSNKWRETIALSIIKLMVVTSNIKVLSERRVGMILNTGCSFLILRYGINDKYKTVYLFLKLLYQV